MSLITAQNQIKRRKTRHLIRFFTVSYKYRREKIPTNTLRIGNGLALLITIYKSLRIPIGYLLVIASVYKGRVFFFIPGGHECILFGSTTAPSSRGSYSSLCRMGQKKWSRVNFVTIFGDLYKIKLWGICNNFNQFAHLSSASGPSNDVIKMAAIAQL